MAKIFISFLLLLSLCASAQEHLLRHEYKYRLTNGFDLLVVEDANATATTLFLSGRIGPYLEDSLTDGAYMVCFELLRSGLVQQLGPNIKVDGHMRTEYFVLELSGLGIDQLETGVETIQTVFTEAWWDSTDVEQAKQAALQQAPTDPLLLAGEQLGPQIWGDAAPQMSDLAPTAKLLAMDSSMVAGIITHMFCPSLMQLAIHSPNNNREVRTRMNLLWNDWLECRQHTFAANAVPSYKTMPFTLQNLEVGAIDTATYLTIAQGPSIFDGEKDLLFGMLIKELLSLSDTVSMLADSLHLDRVAIDVRGGRYTSELWLMAKHHGDSSIISGQRAYQILIDSLTDTNRVLFTEQEMDQAKAKLTDQLQDTVLGIHRTQLLNQNWALAREPFTTFLSNELDKLAAKDMTAHMRKHLKGPNYTSAIILPDSSMLTPDLIEGYTTTHPSIFDHVFHFKKNTGTFVDPAHQDYLNELFQFVNTNSFRLQIIGLSSKEELGEISDREMAEFFQQDSMRFQITSGGKIKKDRIPLELYRVMVVMRYLIDRGVDPKRLFGTGIRLPKKDPFIERAGTLNLKMLY